MGANEWRSGSDWPLPETQWVQVLSQGLGAIDHRAVRRWKRRRLPGARCFCANAASQTNRIQKLRYLSEPLAEDVTIAGPSVLNLFASIDQDDTNWIIILKDVGRTWACRPLAKASATSRPPARTRAHPRLAQGVPSSGRSDKIPARPALASAHARGAPAGRSRRDQRIRHRDHGDRNQFKRGHRICVEITSLDVATGVGSATNVEYIPYHICSSKTVLHQVYHDPKHPSHLLLPGDPGGVRRIRLSEWAR